MTYESGHFKNLYRAGRVHPPSHIIIIIIIVRMAAKNSNFAYTMKEHEKITENSWFPPRINCWPYLTGLGKKKTQLIPMIVFKMSIKALYFFHHGCRKGNGLPKVRM